MSEQLIFRGGYYGYWLASANDGNKPYAYPMDVATTILARDSHGICNKGANIVVEARIKAVGNLGGAKLNQGQSTVRKE